MMNPAGHKRAIIILFPAMILSLWQFLFNRSLWLDEAYLTLNILSKSPFELLKPLELKQVAPILFLEVEKLFSSLISNSEFGLRLFPLAGFWLSLYFFYKITRQVQKDFSAIIFSLFLFSFNPALIYYSSEVKQYMTDVLALTSVYYLLLRGYKNEGHAYWWLGAVGVLTIFLSNVAPMILFTAGFYLWYEKIFRNKNDTLPVILTSLVWASSFVAYYLLFLHDHPDKTGMIMEWENYQAFMPPPFSPEFYPFLLRKASMIFFSLFQFGQIGGKLLFAAAVAGIAVLIIRRKIGILILSIAPIILHMFLSGLKLYPFETRLILYTYPCLVIICSFGFHSAANLVSHRFRFQDTRWLVIVIAVLAALNFYRTGFPLKRCEIKECIRFIELNRHESDRVFINYFAGIPFRYYQEISFTKMEMDSIIFGRKNDMVWNGNRYMPDIGDYFNEVSSLRGRVWFLFTAIGDESEKMKSLTNDFETRGIRTLREFHTEGADVYLYNLSN